MGAFCHFESVPTPTNPNCNNNNEEKRFAPANIFPLGVPAKFLKFYFEDVLVSVFAALFSTG
jgi:hypothetical protein